MSKRPNRKTEPMPDPPELEKDAEKHLLRECTKRRWDCWKLTVPARKGVPDRMILTEKGMTIFAEVKTETGKVSALQARTIKRLSERGFPAFIVRGRSEVDHLINWIEKNDEIRAQALSGTGY